MQTCVQLLRLILGVAEYVACTGDLPASEATILIRKLFILVYLIRNWDSGKKGENENTNGMRRTQSLKIIQKQRKTEK